MSDFVAQAVPQVRALGAELTRAVQQSSGAIAISR